MADQEPQQASMTPGPSLLAAALRKLLSRRAGPSGSSPSVFDAKAAIEENRRKQQQALEGEQP